MSGVVDGKDERAYIASTPFSLGDYLKPSSSPDALSSPWRQISLAKSSASRWSLLSNLRAVLLLAG